MDVDRPCFFKIYILLQTPGCHTYMAGPNRPKTNLLWKLVIITTKEFSSFSMPPTHVSLTPYELIIYSIKWVVRVGGRAGGGYYGGSPLNLPPPTVQLFNITIKKAVI